MEFIKNKLYHLYNQGNNHEKIFHSRDNYLYFLTKTKKYISPFCKNLAYCLMPNHFHFLLYTTENSVKERRIGSLVISNLSNGFRQLLSSYAQAINKQEKRSGSLFRQKTKAKLLECGSENYPLFCFHYIHQNPLRAGLVKKMEDWEFSSFRDYAGMRENSICDKLAAFDLLDLSEETLYEESYLVIPSEIVDEL